ncbi:MAG TPA: hypothetical protein VHK70_01010 [Burkholderiaceae bacterium]|nr:hypothetical protein [Burkholderiaceae bacterium]
MATILPVVTRLTALQKDCAAILPAIFEICEVSHFESGQLLLSIPNAALASKLKQQLPKLHGALLKRGWQINAIRLKVQVSNIAKNTTKLKSLNLPPCAVSAFADLGNTLENSSRNSALKAAVTAMVQRYRDAK